MSHADMSHAKPAPSARAPKSYEKRMSDNVAIALVIYTLLLIFIVTPAIETGGMSITPYFVLIILVGVIIPVFRRFESRWVTTDDNGSVAANLDGRFKRDRAFLWIITIAIPVILGVICRAIIAAT